jgi:hypothetical protein
MPRYIEVDQSEIRKEKVEAAIRMMAYACNKLKIPAPRLRWFTPVENVFNFKAISEFEHDGNLLGLADPKGLLEHGGTIWIRADRQADETAETVAHEVRHVMQFYTLALKYYDMIDTEKLADEFAEEISSEAYLKDNKSYLDYLTGKDFSEGRFKNKELTEAWQRFGQSGAGAKAQAEEITDQRWFIEAARREQEALDCVRRSGMVLGDVPLAGRRRW